MKAKVLSVFDGMACGMIAMQMAGIDVERYVAYEIEKYAVQTSSHNFPMIEHRGDVFKADFTEFEGFDFLIGGSPCTYWSIAQKNNRETEASGMGWELFQQYVRALHEAKPKFFIYENNKSMSKAIRASIDGAFGFEAVCINSALVSAQNRQRLYWVGKRNEDGTYSKVHIEQPEDRGILLKDILECGCRFPEYGSEDKSRPVNALYPNNCGGWWLRVFSNNPNKQQVDMVAEPVCMRYERSDEAKAVTQCGNGGGMGAKTGLYAIPVGKTEELVPTVIKKLDHAVDKFGYVSEMWQPYNNSEITEKSPTLTTRNDIQTGATTILIALKMPCNATPCEWDENGKPIKAISAADGKTYQVYEVKDGQITIKGKQYPIKLADGFYIIRKLTVRECMRLQTVPEWYEFPVSDTQAYKMLGNGWTCAVITHLIEGCMREEA